MKTYLVYANDDQEKIITDFLTANDISFFEIEDDDQELPQHVMDGIKRGEEDIQAGRFITHEEFKRRHPLQ